VLRVWTESVISLRRNRERIFLVTPNRNQPVRTLVSTNVYFVRLVLLVQYDANGRFVERRGVIYDQTMFSLFVHLMAVVSVTVSCSEWSLETNLGWKNYRSSWQPDTGYDDNSGTNRLPLRTFGDNDFYSATMKLDLHTEDFNRECAQGLDVFYVRASLPPPWPQRCGRLTFSFYAQILVHSPAEWPDRTHPTLLVSSNTLKTISVRPIVLTTSDDLISWSPDIRRCYFQNEKRLKFFKVYTQKNCIMECRSVNMLAQCGCVPFNHISMVTVFK